MPRPHGPQAENWWGVTAPTSGLVSSTQWQGVRFRTTAAGRVAGIRSYLHSGDTSTHIGVIIDFSSTDLVRAFHFHPGTPAADGWRNLWFRPWLHVAASHDLVVLVLHVGNTWRRTSAGLASAVTHGHLTFVSGITTAGFDPADSSSWVSTTNANGADVLLQVP